MVNDSGDAPQPAVPDDLIDQVSKPDTGTAPYVGSVPRASGEIAPDDTSTWPLSTRGDPTVPPDTTSAEPEPVSRHLRARHRRAGHIRPRRWAWGTGIAATSLLIVLAGWFYPVGSGTDDPMTHLTTGACFNLSETQLAVVPCTQPHDDEAYYRDTFAPGTFPGDPVVANAAQSTCDAQLAGYVGSGHDDDLFDWPLAPDKSEWAAGIHYTVCALSRVDNRKMTGSARHAH